MVVLPTFAAYANPAWMTPNNRVVVSAAVKSTPWRGAGYFAGEAPDNPSDPNSPDGRTRILGVPASVRVQITEAESGRVLDELISAADGTWRSNWWSDQFNYVIRGFDPLRSQNDAIQGWQRPKMP